MKVIIVSGSVGTGKTVIAKKLAKKYKAKYININDIIKEYKLSEGYDRKRKTKIIDIKKLNKVLIKTIKDSKENLVIDGHLSHYLPKKYVDVCYITKCDLKTLKKRLQKRKYHKSKIEENIQAEIFNICHQEAKHHKIKVINTTKLSAKSSLPI